MCIINFQFHDHDRYNLVVAANRDEFFKRPTAPAHFWEDEPHILAGRDLLQMGTWLGITLQGPFAAVTNFRNGTGDVAGKESRGALIRDYLTSNVYPQDFLELIKEKKDNYNGFNIVLGDADELFYYSNVQDEIIEIPNGTHSVSNHFLNTPWPKVEKGKRALAQYMDGRNNANPDDLFSLLHDENIAEDERLPDTGVGIEMERQLSPIFINMPSYGTRSSTVLLVDHNNEVTFMELTYKAGEKAGEKQFSFQLK